MALEDRAVIVSPCPTPRPAESTSPAARRAVIPALNSRSRPGPTYSFSCPGVRERRCRRGAVLDRRAVSNYSSAHRLRRGIAIRSRWCDLPCSRLREALASVRPEVQVEASPGRVRRLATLSRLADERRNDDAPTHDGDER